MGSKSYSKGISWIDDCRIPYRGENDKWIINHSKEVIQTNPQPMGKYCDKLTRTHIDEPHTQGRFPANLLVSDDMLNDGKIDKKGKTKISQVGKGRGVIGNHDGRKTLTQPKEGLMMARTLGDGGSNSRYYDIDRWFNNLIDV